MRGNQILRRVAGHSHMFDVVALDDAAGCSGVGWRFRDGEGVGQIDFLEISPSLTLDICDFRCFHEKRPALMKGSAPLLKLRFKLSGCSTLQFRNGDVPMLGEHCSVSVYAPRELRHERLQQDVTERSATLHCDAAFFLRDLGLDPASTPQPVRAFLQGEELPPAFLRTRLTARMRQATAELMQPVCAPQFSRAFREVKARDLTLALLTALAETEDRAIRVGAAGIAASQGLSRDELRRATDWLQDNLGDEADTAALARALDDDPIRLARAFKHATGLTVQQYRLRVRAERARQLLAEGKLPIKAVAQDAGFYDQAHLTRSFRAAFGTTPLRYRREYGN